MLENPTFAGMIYTVTVVAISHFMNSNVNASSSLDKMLGL